MERAWATGGRAANAAPGEWRDAIGTTGGDETELRLLALASQAARVALRPAMEPGPQRADLPKLALPTLPEAIRPRFRECVIASAQTPLVVELVAARGWTAHPLDWMPRANASDTLALYRPWVEWAASDVIPEVLDEQTWDELTPAPRRMMLHDLRLADPGAARELMETKLATRPADERADLVAAMRQGLSANDAEFLEGLLADRSGRVREEAGRLLASLDSDSTGATDADGVREAVEARTRGLLRRTRSFKPSEAVMGARHGRFGAVANGTLAGVAAALETDPLTFVRVWEWGSRMVLFDAQVAAMVARTGSDEAVDAALEAALSASGVGAAGLDELLTRIDAPRWQALAAGIATNEPSEDGGDLTRLILSVPPEARELGTLDARTIERGQLLRKLVKDDIRRNQYDRRPGDRLAFLGLMATREAARAVLEAMQGVGRALADPDLALLRLNAALPDAAQDGVNA